MKQYLFDLCLVLLLMCCIGLYFDNYKVSKTLFQRSIDQFEENVEEQEVVGHKYTTLQDESENHVSLLMKKVSDCCIEIIEFIVMIFSNFVSMLLCVMIY